MSLGRIGEFGLISRIRQGCVDRDDVMIGIGDDCSAVQLPAGELLLTTTDMLIEGVHFRRDWTDLFTLGRKSVAVNLSDIAAMGGTPRQIYLGLGLPPTLEPHDFDALTRGVLAAATAYGVVLAGGDTCRSPMGLLISITAQGSAPSAEIVRRSGAQAGDDIYVSGTLGDSGLALQRLLAGEALSPFLAARHHAPVPRLALGRRLAQARIASAMIDLSDGLLADLGHILAASGVGARLDVAALPCSDELRSAVAADPARRQLLLSGGEDYELLFTAPAEKRREIAELTATLDHPVTRIGEMTASAGLLLTTQDGVPLPVERRGFDHFG